jgi:indole-3-glycerol phosphate synthase
VATYLDRIVARHREMAAADDRSIDELLVHAHAMPPARGFAPRLRARGIDGLGVISEIKRRSPSTGALSVDLDPGALAQKYESGGATALSVLTDVEHFGGSIDDLQTARAAVSLPVLRKDFTVCERDVLDARIMGADALLLIAAALTPDELVRFHRLADEIGIDVLVEIHDEAELEVAMRADPQVIGVNQRDLVTFEVDHARAARMASTIPSSVVRVAESGVRDAADAKALRDAGYDAVLVGETLVRSTDPTTAVRELRDV